jgi:non-haem Fe2+, alpha-ketoglutarate-dependent halogenase
LLKNLRSYNLDDYQRNGYLFPIPVLSPGEASTYLSLSNRLEEILGEHPNAVKLTQTHLSFRWAYQLATHPKVLDVVEDILGPDILIWATSIFSKHPHTTSFVSWHQDEKYWGLDSSKLVSAWIALSESSVENGAIVFLTWL